VALLAGFAATAGAKASAAPLAPSMITLAPGVAYVPGDIERSLTCNTGVIIAAGRISLVDAAIPSGAAAAYAAIRAQSGLPLVRVIDTHYHLDHTYGNAFWSERGARPVAFAGMRAELAKSEPELFGGGPGLWQQMSAKLPELRTSRPLLPTFVKSGTTFESGTGAFEIVHPGVAHTHSEAVVWLPSHRVLFTGDLVANGPYNAVADSTSTISRRRSITSARTKHSRGCPAPRPSPAAAAISLETGQWLSLAPALDDRTVSR
jgi:cyclase